MHRGACGPSAFPRGLLDRVRAELVVERHPTLAYLPMDSPEAAGQIASGIYSLEDGRFRWMSRSAVVALKSPAEPMPLRVAFAIPDPARARRVTLLLDGREVVTRSFAGPGSYTLETMPVRPAAAEAMVEILVDQTFSAPGDARELGIVLTGVGFAGGIPAWPGGGVIGGAAIGPSRAVGYPGLRSDHSWEAATARAWSSA